MQMGKIEKLEIIESLLLFAFHLEDEFIDNIFSIKGFISNLIHLEVEHLVVSTICVNVLQDLVDPL